MLEAGLFCLGEEESENQEMQAHADPLYSRLEESIKRQGGFVWELEEDYKDHPDTKGLSYGNGDIYVDPNMSPVNKLRVLVHERAHDLLGHALEGADEILAETQADVVAVAVCGHYGIDFSEDSARYVLYYGGSVPLMREHRGVILETAKKIITEIESVQ